MLNNENRMMSGENRLLLHLCGDKLSIVAYY
jgi:hypothetical protein